ncbi:hypothetical protein GCWU000321_00817 [Dialister invisus DSM 15470]|uniref:Uncharacterized protein n=1 Tax=Dialister invisus DSM 15470 TaxID=592028 RepID=C9LMR3_9FIRM|nr:hypothetical protein GCWU000321_00817 [Dialister invisus DSM 15470]
MINSFFIYDSLLQFPASEAVKISVISLYLILSIYANISIYFFKNIKAGLPAFI